MYRSMYKDAAQYVSRRNNIYYYVRRVPLDVRQHYAASRISFSLRTKSLIAAFRKAHSVSQRLEDYWLGLRLQQMDIPAIQQCRLVLSTTPLHPLWKQSNFTFQSMERREPPSKEQHGVMLSMLQRLYATNQSPPFPLLRPHSSVTGVSTWAGDGYTWATRGVPVYVQLRPTGIGGGQVFDTNISVFDTL